MKHIYLMANAFDRFHSELAICRAPAIPCVKCGYPIRGDETELLFFWDLMHGARERALLAEHSMFWGEFSMATTRKTAEVISSLKMEFMFLETKQITAEETRSRYNIETDNYEIPLLWVRPNSSVDLTENDLRVCDECGKLANAAWKLTGLKVLRRHAERWGVFTVNQNRGAPSFATEEARRKLEATNIRGIKFYKAGMLVD